MKLVLEIQLDTSHLEPAESRREVRERAAGYAAAVGVATELLLDLLTQAKEAIDTQHARQEPEHTAPASGDAIDAAVDDMIEDDERYRVAAERPRSAPLDRPHLKLAWSFTHEETHA